MRLRGEGLRLGYDRSPVCEDLDVAVPDGSFTVIVGANGCGKSTVLRGLARLLKPQRGTVVLDGRDIHALPTKQVARQLGLLPQSPTAPDGITTRELVARGRHPHQTLLHHWSADDEAAVTEAMAVTSVTALADRPVDRLSGGQRQRVWLAMVLAQQTGILLLDEPTTYLDIAHQVDVLELCRDLQRERGYTLVAVLHDLNQACRYATHLIALRDGAIVAEGPPDRIVDEALIESTFGLACRVLDDPETGTPLVVPRAGRGAVSPVPGGSAGRQGPWPAPGGRPRARRS